jgi:dTDP-4-dehydrorhamnose 3,5-epimerase
MQIVDLSLEGLKLIQPHVCKDERGFFLESFQQAFYESKGIICNFVQDNHSFSEYGCIRGMHFQSFPGQAKLVRVVVGEIYDVAVDMRLESPTFGQWEAVHLDGHLHHQLFIPVGFAHGFCVVSKEAHVLYKVSSIYNPTFEKGFRWDDPVINIQWPVKNPIISQRDQQAPFFTEIQQQMESIT